MVVDLPLHRHTRDDREESGFDSMPILTPRWEVAPGELYGRSPAIKAIADIKSINLMALNVLEATELTIRPPLMVPANGIEGERARRPARSSTSSRARGSSRSR